ncbi:Glycosyl transferase, family 14 [Dillenia turbinata]|uniref:Glycosyl transferase, family 14 n=1 Tax=Dillenia turbinata TaxID=194707 RepID=A0AAN8UGZ2_9MAGN
MVLSPTPFSLLCAVLLCLPLAIVFTIITPTSTSTSSSAGDSLSSVVPASSNPKNTTGATFRIENKVKNSSLEKTIPRPSIINVNHTNMTPKHNITTNIINTTTQSPPPQPPPEDDADDEELFRLASRVSSKPLPNSAPKRLAFLFLTTSPLPFAPLWELFFNETARPLNQTAPYASSPPPSLFNVYIHADPSFNYSPPFTGIFSGKVIPSSKPTRRFSPSLIAAARRLLAHALLDDSSNYMFALLSASCIPLHSFHFTYETLIHSRKSFIEILKNEIYTYSRWVARGEHVMLPEVPLDHFRIGSQFFVLTRKHARVVVRDRRLWGKFKLPCVRWDTCYPEENYFPTLLSMRDLGGCVPATLTHVDWKGRHDGHPRTYVGSEVGPELIMTLRSDKIRYGDDRTNGSDLARKERMYPFLFARKFAPDSLQPLMSIANDIIFKD